MLHAAELCGLSFFSLSLCFLVDVFHFLKIENHLENNNEAQKEIFFFFCQMKIKNENV